LIKLLVEADYDGWMLMEAAALLDFLKTQT